jgi:hypothetical protein
MNHQIPRYVRKHLIDGEKIVEVINLHRDSFLSTTKVYASDKRILIAKRIIGIITSSITDISYNQMSSIRLKSSIARSYLYLGLSILAIGLITISGIIPQGLLELSSLNNTAGWVFVIMGALFAVLSVIVRGHSLLITVPGGEPVSLSGVKSSLDKLLKLVQENRSI